MSVTISLDYHSGAADDLSFCNTMLTVKNGANEWQLSCRATRRNMNDQVNGVNMELVPGTLVHFPNEYKGKRNVSISSFSSSLIGAIRSVMVQQLGEEVVRKQFADLK